MNHSLPVNKISLTFISIFKSPSHCFKSFFFFGILILFSSSSYSQAPADPSSIIGKVVCGYQGWFTATGDGSPINRWTHWSSGTLPQAGIAPNPNPNLTFDVYPDVSFYNPASLFQTNFANLGDGNPSKLFSDYKQDVIDKHFQLMQANGIDGVAFQRFIWEVLADPAFHAHRDTIAVHVRASAEKYQRMFYLAYDLSGLGNVPAISDQIRFDSIKGDWQNNMLSRLHITSSPMYAKQGGKPVVQLWGIGYNHIIGTAAIQLDLINWFKAQGCYVIIGVPTGWRTGTGASNAGWINTYKAADMISPWTVGAYIDQASTDNFKTNFLSPDLSYCNTNGIAYQPVIFPGFSWSNWNGGAQNQIPRKAGCFLWHQATNLQSLNIKTAEIAMLDEYDEGTAILPMADGYNMIPTNQYFVTSSADGTYLSSDFYLRLANKVSRVIKGLDAPTPTLTVPYSVAPIYFRTSNEAKYDPQPTWTNTTDALSNVSAYGSNSGAPGCATIQANPHNGQFSLKTSGRDNSATTSYAYFRVYDVNIPVTVSTDLSFWTYPVNSLGRYISVDLVMTDGTTLRDCGATDTNGVSMHPAAGRGIVNTWAKTRSNIGLWLKGKTIDKILIAYDNAPSTGDFTAYIDDISINENSYTSLPLKLLSFSAQAIKNDVQLQWQSVSENNLKQYEIERSVDGNSFYKINTVFPSLTSGIKNYSYTDLEVRKHFSSISLFYYRLKSIDLDNKFIFTNIQSVGFPKKPGIIKIFPNPFNNKIEISVNALKDDYLNAAITTVSGKTVLNSKIKVFKGLSEISLKNLEILPKGIYFLKITMGDETETYKIEK
ncbi:MAG: T9SS type A sorting domain-containing protein [Bacteroidota bacterium]|nr:T9SS type A sorting domain-containing protein [Bacteroidota bacterium]